MAPDPAAREREAALGEESIEVREVEDEEEEDFEEEEEEAPSHLPLAPPSEVIIGLLGFHVSASIK